MNYFINIFESWQPFAVDWSVCLIKAVLIMIAGWWTVNKVCRIALLFFQKTISDKGTGDSHRSQPEPHYG